jgi:squalene-associated FAD-dependent desaturase
VARRIVIIGGGFSGLAAAVALSSTDNEVILLERRSHLGGRAYSFKDSGTGDVVDNGQHLFMRCYDETIAFLEKIGSLEKLKFQPRPRIEFLDKDGFDVFDCPHLPAPWHAVAGLLQLKRLSLRDKLRAARVGRDAQATNPASSHNHITVEQWLDKLGQSQNIKQRFWYPMATATLNQDPHTASAFMMKRVIQDAFGRGPEATSIGIPAVGLSELYTDSARQFVESNGGTVQTSAQVNSLSVRQNRVVSVELRQGGSISADLFISAVTHDALLQMLPDELRKDHFANLDRLETSPIVSINLWFDRPITDRAFIGLLGTRIQWLFNKDVLLDATKPTNQISLIISAARDFVETSKSELVSLALDDLSSLIPESSSAKLLRSVVVKERDATLSHTVVSDDLRPGPQTPIENLILAGDWTATGLPATIESAVLSGKRAAILAHSV